MTLPANIAEIGASDLERLVAERATEGAHLDFKRELPRTWDQEAKKRFIADVVAFANAGGGDLVFGVDEDAEAAASALVPQSFDSVDAEVRRLLDFVLTLVEPRVPGVQVHAVPITTAKASGHCLVVRVPQSWAAPHRSTLCRHFYVRDGLRNRPLDVPEIRSQFMRSDSQVQRMREFRADRLAKIATGQTPEKLPECPKLVVHVIPTQAMLGQVYIDPTRYTRDVRQLPALGRNPAAAVALNLDGAYAPFVAGRRVRGYTQQFRQGYFECVKLVLPDGDVPEPLLGGTAFEIDVNYFLGGVRGELDRLGLNWAMVVFISLLDADKVVFAGSPPRGSMCRARTSPFDRKDIVLPDVLIDAETMPSRGIRPAFDLMCQAAGFEGSASYDENGDWKPID